MKRSQLLRRTPLRSRPQRRPLFSDTGRIAWKEPHAGFCQCGCHRFTLHLERHHIIYEQHVRREGGDVWALSNSMFLHPRCHAQHHSGYRRIPVENLPESALAFAVDLMGDHRAALYLSRYYRTDAL